jgi:D-sedoheptulose 7-phosphate isomerase
LRELIERYWTEMSAITTIMPVAAVTRAAEKLLECHAHGRTVFVLGNGGSAATASHFACDLAKGTRTGGQPAFRVVALTDNVPLITAWGNDEGYERVFADQLSALVRPGDAVVAISASGNSPNILLAARIARQARATTIALTGETGGRLAPLADVVVRVPGGSIEQVEDAHLIVAHSLCVALRAELRRANVTDVVLPSDHADRFIGIPLAADAT